MNTIRHRIIQISLALLLACVTVFAANSVKATQTDGTLLIYLPGIFNSTSTSEYAIDITSPSDGTVFTDREIDISGKILPGQGGFVVEIEGFYTLTDSSGAFTVSDFPLIDGVNALEVILYNDSTPLATDSLIVEFERPGEGASNLDPDEGALVEVTDSSSPLYGTAINIPPHAASRPLRVTIEYEPEHVPTLPYAEQMVGVPAVFNPIGEVFSEPVEISLPVDSALLPAATTINDVRVAAMSDEGWIDLPVTDRSSDSITVAFSKLIYGPFVPVVDIPLQPGELRINSDPAYASIYIDGFNTRLRTPATLTGVAAGDHTLKLYLSGFNEVLQTATVPEGGAQVHIALPIPSVPLPQVTFAPSIFDGMEVNDNIFAVIGEIQYDDAPLNGGTAVISLNDEDSFTNIGPDGAFFGEVSLLPGFNELEVRVNGPNGSTGISERVSIANTEGTTLVQRKMHDSILQVVRTNNAPDITIILTWNKDDTDVDMHVFDPDGNHAWFGDLGGIPGGQLDLDDVNGFGPETFTMLEPRPGTYKVNVDYYSDHDNGPTTASLKVYIGGELKFSESHTFTVGDSNDGGGLGGNLGAFWHAREFTIGELEIVSVRTLTKSPQNAAIFTTHTDENTISVEVSAPDDVADEDIHFDIRETAEDFEVDTEGLLGRQMEFAAEHEPLQGLTNPPNSYRLAFDIVAYTLSDGDIRDLESQPATLIQDTRSQIRQEYVDKRNLRSDFVRTTPAYGDIINAGSFTPTTNFTFAELAAYSDFGPGLAMINDSINIAQTMRDAWGYPLRVTSGWRNPRRNDRLSASSINSFHQTGDAIDLNPTLTEQGWPPGVTTYAQAQQKLTALARTTLDISVHDVLFHANHLHIERDP